MEPEVETKPSKVELNVEETSGSNEGLITQALLVGDLESAVELCVKDKHFTHALTLAAHAGQELYAKVFMVVMGFTGLEIAVDDV